MKCKCGQEDQMEELPTGEFDGTIFYCKFCGRLFIKNPEREYWEKHTLLNITPY